MAHTTINWKTTVAGIITGAGLVLIGVGSEVDGIAADWGRIIPYVISAVGVLFGFAAARDADR